MTKFRFVLLAVAAFTVSACVNAEQDMAELRANPQGELAQTVMILTLPDGEDIPVNYVREEDFVYSGADGFWWRQLRGDGVRVDVYIKGEELTGLGRAVENDKERAREILAKVRPGFERFSPAVPIEIKLDE